MLEKTKLDYSNVRCCGTFLALLNVKGNPIAFIKGLESGCIDSLMMNKYIRSIFLLNEAVAFAAVKPFYNSISHNDILLSKISHSSKLEVANLTSGSFLQNETGPPIKDGPLLIVQRISSF